MKNLSNFVHCNGTSREKLLKTSSLLLDVRRCFEDLVRTNEEQEVNRMLIAEIKLLGKQDVDWRGLQDWEAEMLQKIVGDVQNSRHLQDKQSGHPGSVPIFQWKAEQGCGDCAGHNCQSCCLHSSGEYCGVMGQYC